MGDTRHVSNPEPFSSPLLLSSLELSNTKIYKSLIRALLGTAPHFCQAVVLKLRTVPLGTAVQGVIQKKKWRQVCVNGFLMSKVPLYADVRALFSYERGTPVHRCA